MASNCAILLSLEGNLTHPFPLRSYTRRYLESIGMPAAEPEEIPLDPFAAAKKASTELPPKDNDMKMYMEASLGKFTRDPEDRERFNTYDR